MTEDEIVGWHHRLDGHEFEQVLGVVMDREACMALEQRMVAAQPGAAMR